ncbi:MAG: hypothetical protein IPJ20_19285 [Flammeovirgaceae bacterium]|nr:hypothetical protein [Flammeovirgaceae bacterium]
MQEYFVALDTDNSNQVISILSIQLDKKSHISALLENKKVKLGLTAKLKGIIEDHFDAESVSINDIEFDSNDYSFSVTSIVDQDERVIQLVPVEMVKM